MEMKKIEFSKNFDERIILLRDGATFFIKEVKVSGPNFEAKGTYNDKQFASSAILLGIVDREIKKADDIIKGKLQDDWQMFTEVDEFVSSIEDIAKVLGVGKNIVQRLLKNNALPDPISEGTQEKSKRRTWQMSDLVAVKKFVHMDRYELLRYICQNVVKK